MDRQGDTLYFGSEIKALFASGAVKPVADPRGLDHLFTFFAQGSKRTSFAGIQAIAPGHYLKIAWRSDGGCSCAGRTEILGLPFPDWGDEEDPAEDVAIDAFEAAFTRAVELRLRADVPVVGYLSGGVNSSYVLATAMRVAGRELPSFTVRVPSEGLDESEEAAKTARYLGGRTTVVDASADRIAGNYAALISAAEAPVFDTSCAGLLALSREVHAQGYKVVLTGEGADEGFAGYFSFKIREWARRASTLAMRSGRAPAISRIARKSAARHISFAEFAHRRLYRWTARAIAALQSRRNLTRPLLRQNLKEALGNHVAYDDLDLDVERLRRWHPLNRSLYIGYKIQLAGLLLSQKGDRIAMANSVETRYPFLERV